MLPQKGFFIRALQSLIFTQIEDITIQHVLSYIWIQLVKKRPRKWQKTAIFGSKSTWLARDSRTPCSRTARRTARRDVNAVRAVRATVHVPRRNANVTSFVNTRHMKMGKTCRRHLMGLMIRGKEMVEEGTAMGVVGWGESGTNNSRYR